MSAKHHQSLYMTYKCIVVCVSYTCAVMMAILHIIRGLPFIIFSRTQAFCDREPCKVNVILY